MDGNPTTEELKLAEAKAEGERSGKLSLLRHKLSQKAKADWMVHAWPKRSVFARAG